MIEQSHIQNIVSSLEPAYAAFVQSDFPKEVANQFGNHHRFDVEKKTLLQEAILLYLLTVITSDEFANLIQEKCAISESEAAILVAAIQASIPVIPSEQIQTTANAATPTSSNPTLAADITEAEEALHAISGIRTMAKDMEQVPSIPEEIVYTNTQEALLREGKSSNAQNQ